MFPKMFTIILLFFLKRAHCDINYDLMKEFCENFITKNIAATQNYKLPERNEQFAKGAASEITHDYSKKFDYVIVGGGTAGSVLATRLTQNQNISVALVEAGFDENDFSKIPNMALYLQQSEMNWGFKSTPQTNCCLGMVEQKCMIPRGKVLGGSSSIGFGIYRRSNRDNFNEWAKNGWSYDEALSYYTSSENSQIKGDHCFHGTGGYLNVEIAKPDSPFQSVIFQANQELNISIVDYNGAKNIGVSKIQQTIKYLQKQSSSTAFFQYGRDRSNIEIIFNALVVKINIDENKRAQGVIIIKDDKKYKITARKEVIISAGPVSTPQLLMLSGIGPKDHLRKLNIDVIQNLPVGKNMKDKILLPIVVRTNTTATAKTDLKTMITEYLSGTGPLVKPLYAELIQFIHTDDAPKDTPMFQCLIIPPGRTQSPILSKVFNYNNDVTEKYLNRINVSTDIAFDLIYLRPESAGEITLKSSDPLDHPDINLNYFDNPKDIKFFIKGIKFIIQKLIKTHALQKIGATMLKFGICEDKEEDEDEYYECVLRHLAVSAYEPSGTTPMGSNPANSVVDKKARVHGIQQLRIVDAGIFSSDISTTADTVMAAEKLYDVIKVGR